MTKVEIVMIIIYTILILGGILRQGYKKAKLKEIEKNEKDIK